MEYGQLRDLKSWPDGWRFPDVWLRILHDEEPDTDEVLPNLLRGCAVPTRPSELWNRLLTDGEFMAADALLHNREFLANWPERKQDELEQELERHRSERRHGLERAEQELLKQEYDYYSPPSVPDNGFQVDCAITQKEWSYDKDPTDRLCRWVLEKDDLQRAPLDFQEQCRFDNGDLYAAGLARSLLELLECPVPERGERLESFVHAFANFLRNKSTLVASVRDAGDYFVTELTGCSSPWLPTLHARHGLNIPLIVPHMASAKIIADEIGDGSICLLDIWKLEPKTPEHCIHIATGWLFRLMGLDGKQRLDAFHCFLGQAIPLRQLLPKTDSASDCETWLKNFPILFAEHTKETGMTYISSIDEAYTLVSGFFRVHGIREERHGSDFARLAQLAVGPAWIFCRYLRRLLQELVRKEGIGQPVLDYQLIETVWNEP